MKKLRSLLTFENAKTIKGEKLGYLTGILYLSPFDLGGVNLCKFSSPECRKNCLYFAGRGQFNSVKNARMEKTRLFNEEINYFMQSLIYSINIGIRKAKRENLTLVIRLNGTSDISWENLKDKNGMTIFDHFKEVQFYDYTKNFTRFNYFKTELPKNYHLTFSSSGKNEYHVKYMINRGVNVTYIFDKLPEKFKDLTVINGDSHDLRFLDQKNVIVGLIPKGKLKKIESSFKIQAA